MVPWCLTMPYYISNGEYCCRSKHISLLKISKMNIYPSLGLYPSSLTNMTTTMTTMAMTKRLAAEVNVTGKGNRYCRTRFCAQDRHLGARITWGVAACAVEIGI